MSRVHRMDEKVFVRTARAKLKDADVRLHRLIVFRGETQIELADDLSAIRGVHDRTVLIAIPVTRRIAATKKVGAIRTDGFVRIEAEKLPRGIVPENDAVQPVRYE